jgi:hypothetical protein
MGAIQLTQPDEGCEHLNGNEQAVCEKKRLGAGLARPDTQADMQVHTDMGVVLRGSNTMGFYPIQQKN